MSKKNADSSVNSDNTDNDAEDRLSQRIAGLFKQEREVDGEIAAAEALVEEWLGVAKTTTLPPSAYYRELSARTKQLSKAEKKGALVKRDLALAYEDLANLSEGTDWSN